MSTTLIRSFLIYKHERKRYIVKSSRAIIARKRHSPFLTLQSFLLSLRFSSSLSFSLTTRLCRSSFSLQPPTIRYTTTAPLCAILFLILTGRAVACAGIQHFYLLCFIMLNNCVTLLANDCSHNRILLAYFALNMLCH